MAPVRPRTRASLAAGSPSSPAFRSPIKKRKHNISIQQKQVLIDNLQLEITERARRLRAQYHLQAQGMRSRIEIRVNRIPVSLRKMELGDLIKKYSEQKPVASRRAPPVPTKGIFSHLSPQRLVHKTIQNHPGSQHQIHLSEVSSNKENEDRNGESPKKRNRLGPGNDAQPRPAILSPTSYNSRIANYQRSTSPTKTNSSRASSPTKGVSSMPLDLVGKTKATKTLGARKATAPFIESAGNNGAPKTAAAKSRSASGPGTVRAPGSRPGTRNGRRASATSEDSEGTNATNKKRPGSRATGTAATRRPGTASTKSADAKKAAATAPGGRVLRRRA